MDYRKRAAGAAMGFAVLVLAGCGDGGGVASTGTAPPVPVNASLAAQHVSQSFTNNAATTTASFDLASSNTTSGSSTSAPLTFSYDAGSNSYTVSTQGRSQTFAPGDITSAASGQAIYHKTVGTNRDYLTVLAASVTGASGIGPQYTGMAYWQRSIVTGSTQDTTFDIFTYGLDTPAAAVPRSGQASFATTVFGLSTVPGSQPSVFQGTGSSTSILLTAPFQPLPRPPKPNWFPDMPSMVAASALPAQAIFLQRTAHSPARSAMVAATSARKARSMAICTVLTAPSLAPLSQPPAAMAARLVALSWEFRRAG